MREFFVAFRSRSDALRFYEEISTYRVPAKLINTPSSAGVGCGLSVKLLAKSMGDARRVLERMRLGSVIGFFRGWSAIKLNSMSSFAGSPFLSVKRCSRTIRECTFHLLKSVVQNGLLQTFFLRSASSIQTGSPLISHLSWRFLCVRLL